MKISLRNKGRVTVRNVRLCLRQTKKDPQLYTSQPDNIPTQAGLHPPTSQCTPLGSYWQLVASGGGTVKSL